MKREFMVCCVCGKKADRAAMTDHSPWRGMAREVRLTLKAPNENQIHPKCRDKLRELIAYKTALRNVEIQKQLRDDQFHRSV